MPAYPDQGSPWAPSWQPQNPRPVPPTTGNPADQYTSLQNQLGAPSTDGVQLPGAQALWSMLQNQYAPAMNGYDQKLALLGLRGGITGQIDRSQMDAARHQAGFDLQQNDLNSKGAKDTLARALRDPKFIEQTFKESNKSAALQYDSSKDSLLSDATSRGAVNAHGTVKQFSGLYQNLTNQLAQNKTSRDRSLADSSLAIKQAQDLGQQYGINHQEIVQKLNDGLKQMGLGSQLDFADVLSAMNSTNADKAGLAQKLFQDFVLASNNSPEYLKWFQGMSNGGVGQAGLGGGGSVKRNV